MSQTGQPHQSNPPRPLNQTENDQGCARSPRPSVGKTWPPATNGHVPATYPATENRVPSLLSQVGRPRSRGGHGVNTLAHQNLKHFLACRGTPLWPAMTALAQRCARSISGSFIVPLLFVLLALIPVTVHADLHAGFAERDITPDVKKREVWLAGYGQGRKATGVHDPLFVRVVVLKHGKQKIALACADLVGVMLPTVERIRAELKDFDYVMVSATHNHEGPDTVGLWGRSPVETGVDPVYMKRLIAQTVKAIREADKNAVAVTVGYGTADDNALLNDSRQPRVFDGTLRAMRFTRVDNKQTQGLLVQWNCHPEAMGSKNLQVTADFVAATVDTLKKKHNCPVAYFSGPVGGLLAPPRTGVNDANGNKLHAGDFEYTETYGRMVATLADKALSKTKPITLTPFKVVTHRVSMPLWNPMYMLARRANLIERDAFFWTGDSYKRGKPFTENLTTSPAIETEVAAIRLGQLHIACIPGEIYPELVTGHIQEPIDKGADFPDAAKEKHLHALLPDKPMLIIGLANDEIGYIIPKRQWDAKPPWCYGLPKMQYGEINSVGPEVAPIIMQAFERCVKETTGKATP